MARSVNPRCAIDSERAPARTENLLGATALAVLDVLAERAFAPAKLGERSAAALASLVQEPGMTIVQLSAVLDLSHSATVRLVDRLVARRLARRRPTGRGRAVAVDLTTDGRRAAVAVIRSRRDALTRAVAELDDAQRDALTDVLERLLASLTTSAARGDIICRLCSLDDCPQDRCPVAFTQTAPGVPD